MAEPLAAGAVQLTAICALPGTRVGAAVSGAPAFAVAEADQGPAPCVFAAANWTW